MDRNLRLLGVGAGVRLFGAAMVYPYISLYMRNILNIGYADIGIILLLISVVPLAVAPFGGLIADRAGRRPTFLLSLGGEAASVLLVALSMGASWFPGVVLGGIAAGMSGQLAGPAVSAYVADFAVGSDRTQAYTWVRIGFNAGFTVGVFLGGFLIGFIGYPDTGIFSSGILVVSTLFLFALLSPSPYDLARSKSPNVAGAAGQEPTGPGSIRESIRILAHDKQFLVFCMASALVSLTYGQWSTTFVLFVNTVLKVPTLILGGALALNGAIVIFGQTATTKAMLGRRHTFSAFLAIALMIVSFLTLGALSLYGAGVLVAVFSFIIILTIGENLGAIPGMTLSSNLASKTEIGAYNGAFQLLSGIGGAFAPTVGGFTLAATTNPLLVWGVLALPGVPAMLLFLWLGGRIPAEANRI